jgi:hypothetical protein
VSDRVGPFGHDGRSRPRHGRAGSATYGGRNRPNVRFEPSLGRAEAQALKGSAQSQADILGHASGSCLSSLEEAPVGAPGDDLMGSRLEFSKVGAARVKSGS